MSDQNPGIDCDYCGGFIAIPVPVEGEPTGEFYTPAETLEDRELPDVVCRTCALKHWPQVVGEMSEIRAQVNALVERYSKLTGDEWTANYPSLRLAVAAQNAINLFRL